MPAPLPLKFFARDTITVARELVGCELHVTGKDGVKVTGRIVEVEAYGGENDPASHAGRGITPRSEIMFGPAGFAYVYLIYGMHHCLNFVTEAEGTAGAVLIRALEPLAGLEVMAHRRGLDPRTMRIVDLCSGPGRLCQACGITRDWNGMPLLPEPGGPLPPGENRIMIFPGAGPPGGPEATARIGISKATNRRQRFIYTGSEFLSG